MAQSKSVSTQDSALETTIKHMLEDLYSFKSFLFSPEVPYCVQANEEGVKFGTFMAEHSDIATYVKSKKEELVAAMKKISGLGSSDDLPAVDITYFQNWGSNAHDSNGLMLLSSPTKVAHVRKLILGAKACNPPLKVGCGGAYHSWTPLYPDKSTTEQVGLLINTYSLLLDPQDDSGTNRRIYLNSKEKKVTISPGVTSGELAAVFLQQGVDDDTRCCFLSNVVLGTVTYGGIVATGCHGTGKDQMTLSDLIVSMKIVDCSGEVRTYPQDLPAMPKGVTKVDAMNALRLGLGVFGIIVELTMKVEEMKTAHVQTSYPTMGELLYGATPTLQELVASHDTLEFLWFPFNGVGDLLGALLTAVPFLSDWNPRADQAWVRAINWKSENYVSPSWPQMTQKLTNSITGLAMGEIGSPVLQRYPSLTPLLLYLGFQSVQSGNPEGCKKEEMTYAIHFRYGIDFSVVYCMEFAFPFNIKDKTSFEKILTAIRYVVEKVKNAAAGTGGETQSFPLSACIDFRVITKSDCLICPSAQNRASGDTNTAYIEVLSFAGTDTYRGLFQDIGQKWLELGGLPHWAKQWMLIPGIYEAIQEKYGANLEHFKTVLETLGKKATGKGETEPWKMFINSTMQKVLGCKADESQH